jgi:hypothetical protein
MVKSLGVGILLPFELFLILLAGGGGNSEQRRLW